MSRSKDYVFMYEIKEMPFMLSPRNLASLQLFGEKWLGQDTDNMVVGNILHKKKHIKHIKNILYCASVALHWLKMHLPQFDFRDDC